MTRSLFSPLNSTFLGFDRLFDELDSTLSTASTQSLLSGFPPVNIFKDDNSYTIELAVAGFKQSEISIEHDEKRGRLTISGDKFAAGDTAETEIKPAKQVVRQGIANRKFEQTFKIAENLRVESAALEDGMLIVTLKMDEAKTYSPRKIELNQSALESPKAELEFNEPDGTSPKAKKKLT